MFEQQVNKEVLYRAYGWVDYTYDGDFPFDKEGKVVVEIRYDKFPILRYTPCGMWIDTLDGRERWVGKGNRKAYAYPTKEEALRSLKIRNYRRIQYLKRDLEKAMAIKERLNEMEKEEE